jgi:hypothetical protein
LSPIMKVWRYLQHGPAHFIMYVLGRFNLVRSLMVYIHRQLAVDATIDALPTPRETAAIVSADIERAAKSLAEDGYCAGLQLGPEALENLRRFSYGTISLAEGDERFPFAVSERAEAERKYGRKIRIGRFDHAMQNCPEIRSLATDPTIIGIARTYLECQPVYLGARIWWSFPANVDTSEKMSLGQGFHYDLDGYRSVAFFFNLTDVDHSSGAHALVRGSHLNKPWAAVLSLHKGKSDAQIEKWYGKENQVLLCGSAGSGFAEDLFCYHKGLHPVSGDRLMLQLRFGLRRYYEEPYSNYQNVAKYGKAARA